MDEARASLIDLLKAGRRDLEATLVARKCVAYWEKIAADKPDNVQWTYHAAMAHWRLGNKDEARQWYDQAVEWMERNQPQAEALRRFRAEAEKLLGVRDTKG